MAQNRLVILYVEGSFGIGKTTVLNQIVNSSEYLFSRARVNEPMRAWRSWFTDDHDSIKEVYETQKNKDTGFLGLRESSKSICYAQLSLSAPFYIMNNIIGSRLNGLTQAPAKNLDGQDYLLLFDRHPIASCFCFPLARFISGYLEYTDMFALASTMPDSYISQSAIAILDLDIEEQARRIIERSRNGEHANINFLRVLRNVFVIVYNSVVYLKNTSACNRQLTGKILRDFRDSDFELKIKNNDLKPLTDPKLGETVFAVLADSASLSDSQQTALYTYAIEKIANVLQSLNVFFIKIDKLSVNECADKIIELSSESASLLIEKNTAETLFKTVNAYNIDMTV
ncbi:Thymidine kinase [Cacatuid alphaherpesvirus 2]|uniref:Thymidine kinase n=1 Tax=Cacatuid alphaherpesvirus 2 TaxID=2604840 RepID=A0A5B9RBE8_9ALPH|nr:Thymidine kinase [Cacatuid alphaherpesvirus 2]QEG54085.1 Thymidine kinase [Cacatuid alphaherpesvirus 2]